MQVMPLADDSHEMSRLFFHKNKKEFRMSSATNFAWHFKGWIFDLFEHSLYKEMCQVLCSHF